MTDDGQFYHNIMYLVSLYILQLFLFLGGGFDQPNWNSELSSSVTLLTDTVFSQNNANARRFCYRIAITGDRLCIEKILYRCSIL